MQHVHAISQLDAAEATVAPGDRRPPERAAARRAHALTAAFAAAILATAAVRLGSDSASAAFPLLHVALALAAGWLLPWEAALASAWLTSVATQLPTMLGGPGDPLVTMLEGLATTAVAAATLLVVRRQRERLAAAAADETVPLVDPASGLANEHALALRAAAELSRARRHDEPLTLVWIAIDGLAPGAADHELRRLGAAILGAVRGEDLVARVDAAELALLLPEAGPAAADAISNRVGAALARALDDEGTAGAHATIAAAHYPGDALTVDELGAAARERATAARH